MIVPRRLYELRVGFSYALEALFLDLHWDDLPEEIQGVAERVRTTNWRLAAAQPPCVRDRFAVYAQTLRLSREETEALRDHLFEHQSADE